MCRVMRVEPEDSRELLLWILCMQIDGHNLYDQLFAGLNTKGINDMKLLINSILYEYDEPENIPDVVDNLYSNMEVHFEQSPVHDIEE